MARKVWLVARVVMFISIILILWNLLWIYNLNSRNSVEVDLPSPVSRLAHPTVSSNAPPKQRSVREINIAVVVCGNRVNETLVLMKSALIFSHTPVKFIIFADDKATLSISDQVGKWPQQVLDRMKLDIRPITFPAGKEEEWKKLFKPCASQRLFLPVSTLQILILIAKCILLFFFSESFTRCGFFIVHGYRYSIFNISQQSVGTFQSDEWFPDGCCSSWTRRPCNWMVQPICKTPLLWWFRYVKIKDSLQN